MRLFSLNLALMLLVALGCAEVGQPIPSSGDAQPVVFNAEERPTVEIEVPGLHCENCSATACKLLADMPGVIDVKADAETKKAVVAVDESQFDAEGARTALEEQFGEATLVGADDES